MSDAGSIRAVGKLRQKTNTENVNFRRYFL